MAISEINDEGAAPIKLWTPAEGVEESAQKQLRNIAKLPWVFHHVAVMPDVHYGKGATVGSVIAMKNAVSPAAVGVDIGCGMGAIRTNLKPSDLPDNLKQIRLELERRIPVGFNQHDEPVIKASNDLFREFSDLHHGVQDLESKARKQCGTLGGGNHFIELCVDEGSECSCVGYFGVPKSVCPDCRGSGRIAPRVWLMLHSGSRNIGKTLAEIHMAAAKKLAHNAELPDPDLAVFLAGTPEMEAYRRDLYWAQRYAFLNRKAMFEIYQSVMQKFFPRLRYEDPILCHHNYVAEEYHYGEELIVTRKGAINAERGVKGIIPGSMGTKSYIVEGLGNAESFNSASHGAGRRMSRGKAKRTYTLNDMIQQTQGVECRKTEDVLDEIPGAYKDIDVVMANQADLVKILYTLKQVLCVKG
jgi:tRNA-splicing ligase RtcB